MLGDVKKQHGECSFVVAEYITYECYEFSFFLWFAFLVVVTLQYLSVARCFYLFEKSNTSTFCSSCDEQMGKNVFCFVVDGIEIIIFFWVVY